MSAHPRVVYKRRENITALPLYYSGHLLKKHKKEKEFKRYHGELRGATLFLYKNDTAETYIEKLNLEEIKSMDLDSPYQKKTPTVFTLKLHKGEVHLKTDSPDAGEEWRAYILTVITKEIPSKLYLLPGQMLQLEEILALEKRRTLPMPCPPLPPRSSFPQSASPFPSPSPPPPKDEPDDAPEFPSCFFNVTRQEAEHMLEANPEYGGMILRPSTLANSYALTLRQLTNSGPVMRNYRVTSTNSGFVIELETAVTVSTLSDVIDYFLEKTEYRLHPYMSSQPYDTRIDVSPAPKYVSTIPTTLKPVPQAQVAPTLRSNTNAEPPPPPPPARPAEGEYVVADSHCPDDHKQKLVQLDGELRKVLKIRRETFYNTTTEEEEDDTYENERSEKFHSGTAEWNMKSSDV